MTHTLKLTALALLLFASITTIMAATGSEPEWYRSNIISANGTVIADSLRADNIDLLYLVSTEVMEAHTPGGTPSYQSFLTPSDRHFIDAELAYVAKEIGRGDFNFLAPYYHQYTFSATMLPKEQFDSVYHKVYDEVQGIFNHYLEHINQGRRFALVGFSQGAMLVLDILKNSTPQQLQGMVGAYLIGYGLNEQDLRYATVVPATGPEGFGHTISFNSVLSPNGTWPFVYNNATTIINPVNWQTTATPATFQFEGDTLTATIDPNINELIITVPDKKPYHDFMQQNPAFKMANVSPDCLHHWDLLFYTKALHDNILLRGSQKAIKTDGETSSDY